MLLFRALFVFGPCARSLPGREIRLSGLIVFSADRRNSIVKIFKLNTIIELKKRRIRNTFRTSETPVQTTHSSRHDQTYTFNYLPTRHSRRRLRNWSQLGWQLPDGEQHAPDRAAETASSQSSSSFHLVSATRYPSKVNEPGAVRDGLRATGSFAF